MAAQQIIFPGCCAAKAACLVGSPLERGVRQHIAQMLKRGAIAKPYHSCGGLANTGLALIAGLVALGWYSRLADKAHRPTIAKRTFEDSWLGQS